MVGSVNSRIDSIVTKMTSVVRVSGFLPYDVLYGSVYVVPTDVRGRVLVSFGFWVYPFVKPVNV